ncbi:pentapeptide repeat-containing protein [Caulobacter vibrioides]|uniref:Pentapeptide repeat-containing protein n=1 Tax=Caulobacter vibrioides TaxID=155892 RepID=A0A290MJ34_CAUVI|nr:pentapeptide repeat-containing protein [Caulobacter vibrioides]ATC31812.1 pentapeptide repeat-containing protein [Caulobacter vibrioides]
MKPIAQFAAAALGVALVAATPASAQNAGQIAAVRNGAHCPRCNLFQADVSNLTLKGKNLAGARLRQADLSTAVMNRSSFASGDLRDVNAYGGVFTGASFARADLTNASFVGAYLQGANFTGARLAGVNFSGAEMGRAAGLKQSQLNQACGDDSTLLPRGLSIPRCR